jgi:hypothetical protein
MRPLKIKQFVHRWYGEQKYSSVNTIKWLGTILIIVATMLRTVDYNIADMSFGLIGTMLWAYASYVEKDKPLFTVNMFIILVLLFGLVL